MTDIPNMIQARIFERIEEVARIIMSEGRTPVRSDFAHLDDMQYIAEFLNDIPALHDEDESTLSDALIMYRAMLGGILDERYGHL